MSSAPGRDGYCLIGLFTVPVILLSLLAAALADDCSARPAASPPDPTTLFGTTVWQAPGETRRDALARVDSAYGPIAVVRVFSPWLPPSWAELEESLGPRPLVVSFRLPPAVILSGRADAHLGEWFRAAPTDRDTYWVYFHEPEDDVERGAFTPQEFVAAWTHIERLSRAAGNPRLKATVVLMCWTVSDHSGRDWRHYLPDAAALDVLAWDCYAKGAEAASYADVNALLDPARRASEDAGAGWGIAELGARLSPVTDGGDRARWLEAVGAYACRHEARFVTYFDAPVGGEFRLADEPSVRAWARLVRSSAGRRRGSGTVEEAA